MLDRNQQADRATDLIARLLAAAPTPAMYALTVGATHDGRTLGATVGILAVDDETLLFEDAELNVATALCAVASSTLDGGVLSLDDLEHVRAWTLRAGAAHPLTADALRAHPHASVLLDLGSAPVDAYSVPDITEL